MGAKKSKHVDEAGGRGEAGGMEERVLSVSDVKAKLKAERMSRERFIKLIVPVLEGIYAAKARGCVFRTREDLSQIVDHNNDMLFPDGCVDEDEWETGLKPLIESCFSTDLKPYQFRDINALASLRQADGTLFFRVTGNEGATTKIETQDIDEKGAFMRQLSHKRLTYHTLKIPAKLGESTSPPSRAKKERKREEKQAKKEAKKAERIQSMPARPHPQIKVSVNSSPSKSMGTVTTHSTTAAAVSPSSKRKNKKKAASSPISDASSTVTNGHLSVDSPEHAAALRTLSDVPMGSSSEEAHNPIARMRSVPATSRPHTTTDDSACALESDNRLSPPSLPMRRQGSRHNYNSVPGRRLSVDNDFVVKTAQRRETVKKSMPDWLVDYKRDSAAKQKGPSLAQQLVNAAELP